MARVWARGRAVWTGRSAGAGSGRAAQAPLALRRLSGTPATHQLEVAALREEDVVRLQIAVDDPLAVHVRKGQRHLRSAPGVCGYSGSGGRGLGLWWGEDRWGEAQARARLAGERGQPAKAKARAGCRHNKSEKNTHTQSPRPHLRRPARGRRLSDAAARGLRPLQRRVQVAAGAVPARFAREGAA